MDFLKPQRKIPRPRQAISVGTFRHAPKQHKDIPTTTTHHEFYHTNNDYLPVDTIQKVINSHHFNQQIQIGIPIDQSQQHTSSPDQFISQFNQQLYSVLQDTHVYHVQCDLGLLFTEPFASTYFPTLRHTPKTPNAKSTSTTTTINTTATSTNPSDDTKPIQLSENAILSATSTHTTLHQNSFSIVQNAIFFNLDKDSYQALGFTSPHTIVNGMYRFQIPINLTTVERLRTRLSTPHINSLNFVVFVQDGGVVSPIDFTLLFQAQHTKQQLAAKLAVKMGSIPTPINTAPPLTMKIPMDDENSKIGDTFGQGQPLSDDKTIVANGLTPTITPFQLPTLNYYNPSGILFSQQLNTDPSQPPQTIISIKRLKFRYQTDRTTFQSIPYMPATPAAASTPTPTAPTTATVPIKITNQSLLALMGGSAAAPFSQPTPITQDMTRTTPSLFPRLLRSTILSYISSFYTHKTPTTNDIDTQCKANLQNRLDREVQLVSYGKSRADKKAQKALASGIINNDVDSDSDDEEEGYDPKYASFFVQRVKNKTQSPPSTPTTIYQTIAQQLQLYIALVYTHNYNYITTTEQLLTKGQERAPKKKITQSEAKFSHLNLPPTQSQSQSPQPSPSTGLTTISIRGILPTCIILHIVKHLRCWIALNSNQPNPQPNPQPTLPPTPPNPYNYCFISAYGIPSAVTNYSDRIHGDSCGLGGTGESNFTLILAENDQNPDQHKNNSHAAKDVFVLFRNIDHQSKEF